MFAHSVDCPKMAAAIALAAALLFALPAFPQHTGTKPAEEPSGKSETQPTGLAGLETGAPENETGAPGPKEEAGMRYRLVGPFRGGRSLTASGVPGNPEVYYFGAAGGGVWKTTDAGLTWKPVFEKEGSSSIGSLAVASSDPNVIYAGTGEACIRGDLAQGDGVYKSVDAGATWKNVGLKDTRAIGKIIVHPRNPDIVFVAALGHVYGPNTERGIFRSTDGGQTWQKVLYKNENTGGIDIAFDPNNPHILFAALWEARRAPWSLSSGGEGSGLYRSSDGGSTWTELTAHGLPAKPYGRIGVAVAASSDRVWALIEAKEGGLYRSDDGGKEWQLINPDHRFTQRAWYYMHMTADPQDAGTVYILNVNFHRSNDGGHTFNKIRPPHGDNHSLWIDPKNTRRMIETNDGGATISVDGGKTWSREDNQPTAQFYHVITDDRFPYYLYGSQQDNSTVAIASRSDSGEIDRSDWYPVGGGESGHIAPYPLDPLVVYAGGYQGHITRFNKHTGQTKEITVYPRLQDAEGAARQEHRFQWTAPLLLSPRDPNVLYHAAERLFRSTDAGMHWEAISPDLTRNDKSKQQPSGGPITIDDTGTEFYDTIFAVAESPLEKGVIWAGSDDGLVHVTRDAGAHWTNVTPPDMPEWTRVSLIEASPHQAAKAYVAANRYQLDDMKPYIWKTSDFGKTWTKIVSGIPEGSFARAVREDPSKPGLLYAGTETGVWVSYDDGGRWHELRLNLPTTPVHDLRVKGNDLVLATHGRSFWILDDVTPLRQSSREVESESAHLYRPAAAVRTQARRITRPNPLAGQNPPPGAVIYFRLDAPPKEEAALEILDAQGQRVRRVSSKEFEPLDAPLDPDDKKPEKQLKVQAGLNRYVWDLRYDPVSRLPNYYLYDYQPGTVGPLALPGFYQVRLTVDGKTATTGAPPGRLGPQDTVPLEVQLDPRVQVSRGDLEKQLALVLDIQGEMRRLYNAAAEVMDLRSQNEGVRKRLAPVPSAKQAVAASEALDGKMAAIQEALLETRITANEDSLRIAPKLDAKLSYLAEAVERGSDSAPTAAAHEEFDRLKKEVETHLAAWRQLLDHEVASFQRLLQQQNYHALILPPTAAASSGGVR